MVRSISRIIILSVLFISVLFLTCSKDSTGPKDEDGTLINANEGGIVISSDGLLTLTIPPNALEEDTYIDIKELAEADYPTALDTIEIVGKVYNFKPDSLILIEPALLEINLPQNTVDEIMDDDWITTIGCFSISTDGTIEEADSSLVVYNLSDSTAICKAQIEHFSIHYTDDDIYTYHKIHDYRFNIGKVLFKVDFGPDISSPGAYNEVQSEVLNDSPENLWVHYYNYGLSDPIYWNEFTPRTKVIEPYESYIDYYLDWNCIKSSGAALLEVTFKFSPQIDNPTSYYDKIREASLSQVCECVSAYEIDSDSDGIVDGNDNCPDYYNPDQSDNDSDGVGDECDNCPDDVNINQLDIDRDGLGDVCDNCPDKINGGQEDKDEDGVGDECDNCPEVPNTDQLDTDQDELGDVCDNCPVIINFGQEDMDYDNIGDICDNCPEVPNADQLDSDNDYIGDACDNNDCGDTNFETAVVFFYSIFDLVPCDKINLFPETATLPGIGYDTDLIIPDYSFWPTPYATGSIQINITVDDFGNIHLNFPGSENGFYIGPVPNYKLPSQLQGFPPGDYVFLFIIYRGDINLITDTVTWENDLFINAAGDFTGGYTHPSGDLNHPSTNANYFILSKYDPSSPFGSWGNIIFDVTDGNYNQIYVDVSLLYFGNVAMYIIPQSMLGNTAYYRFLTEYIGGDGMTKYYTPDWIMIP